MSVLIGLALLVGICLVFARSFQQEVTRWGYFGYMFSTTVVVGAFSSADTVWHLAAFVTVLVSSSITFAVTKNRSAVCDKTVVPLARGDFYHGMNPRVHRFAH